MGFEYYVRSGQTNLRCGFTTGTCASIAAKIACQGLLSGSFPDGASVLTKKGIKVTVPFLRCGMGTFDGDESEGYAWASVQKDAGDDSDVTHGTEIVSQVRVVKGESLEVIIDGGRGVGRVTKPGLNQPVGNAAINSGPRESIETAVKETCEEFAFTGTVYVTVIVPEGEMLAEKTFNPALGIEGGISILGTSGIVEPMSEKALVDTIETTLKQARIESNKVILTPGNIGYDFLAEEDYLSLGKPVVKISNFIGEALDIAKVNNYAEVLLVGNIGKLCKLAAGIMNTHSKYADGRNEVFTSLAAVNGASGEVCRQLMDAVSTDAFIEILDKEGLREKVLDSLMKQIQKHLNKRAKGAFRVGAVTFSSVYGYLGQTEEASAILDKWKEE